MVLLVQEDRKTKGEEVTCAVYLEENCSCWVRWETPNSARAGLFGQRSSVPSTSCSDKAEQETAGPRDTTPKELSLLTLSSMSSERRLRLATAFRDSRSAIHLEEKQDQVWEHSSSPKLEKNTQTE